VYKAVLIGLGNIAWKLGHDPVSGSSLSHKNAYDQNKKIALTAGYSPDDIEIDRFVQNCSVMGYNNLEEMLEQEGPDIVSICSPQEFHAEQLKVCFNYHVPMVWLEKPAATSIDELKKLEQLRTQMQQPSMVLVNFHRRYAINYQKLKRLLQNEIYGQTLAVEIHYSRGLMVNGSHMIDLLFYLFPESRSELLWVEHDPKSDNPDFVLRLSNKLIVHVSGIDAAFHNIDVRVTCQKARLSIDHGGMTARVEEIRENELFAGYYRLYDQQPDVLGVEGFNHAFDNALDNLIESYEQRRQPNSNLVTALWGQTLVEKVLNQNIT
jgi:predicted dehydrogenase